MRITHLDRVRMERAHVLAWPALQTAVINGWLWRSSGGGSQRANSVSTIDFIGSDVEHAIREVESRYHAISAVARFQTFDETSPPGLKDVLQRRGYRHGEPTVTMFRHPRPGGETAADVEIHDHATDEWLSVYLGAITENRRAANAEIIRHIRAPHAFFSYRHGCAVVSTALCVVGHGCAVIECVATRADARRQGAANAVLSALTHWAVQQGIDWIGLQVVRDNTPAVTLYQNHDFVTGATNTFWVRL
jgi:ribosomal protein S18 acetylase RimI-like enzyme